VKTEAGTETVFYRGPAAQVVEGVRLGDEVMCPSGRAWAFATVTSYLLMLP
jgi:hypothetical protein